LSLMPSGIGSAADKGNIKVAKIAASDDEDCRKKRISVIKSRFVWYRGVMGYVDVDYRVLFVAIKGIVVEQASIAPTLIPSSVPNLSG
jgi:hypothetical protein